MSKLFGGSFLRAYFHAVVDTLSQSLNLTKTLKPKKMNWNSSPQQLGSMIVNGTATGHDKNLIIEWECPFSGKLLSCQGEFQFDGDSYYHDVRDSHTDELLYTVIA